MIIEAQEMPQKESFQYLSFIINKDGEIEEDVELKRSWIVEVETCFWNVL